MIDWLIFYKCYDILSVNFIVSDIFGASEAHLRHFNVERALFLEEHVYKVLSCLVVWIASLPYLFDAIELEHFFLDQLVDKTGHDVIPVEQNVLKKRL